MPRILTAINRERETAWRRYKRLRDTDQLLRELERLDKLVEIILEADRQERRILAA